MRRLAVVFVAFVSMAVSAKADFTLGYETTYTGTSPSGSAPWLTATFEDNAQGVLLTLTNTLHVPNEFLSEVAFNFDSSVSGLTATFVSGQNGTFSTGNNIKNGWGDAGKFDFGFLFETSNNSNRFTMGEVAVFQLKADTQPTSSQFLAITDKGYLSAAHFQGYSDGGSGKVSGCIRSVPEPASMALILIGVPFAIFHRRRMTRKNSVAQAA